MNIRNQQAFSIVEALVASLILTISVVGVFATMSAQKAPTASADKRVQAALAGKQFLEDLRSKVDATTYNQSGGPFDPATNPHGPFVVNGYTINYNVTAVGNARKVDLSVTW